MGYDLIARKPRDPEKSEFHFGAFTFPWLLDEGVGLVIGCAPARGPVDFSYTPDSQGRCPRYNDGFHVTVAQAKMMAAIARGLVLRDRFIYNEWLTLARGDAETALKLIEEQRDLPKAHPSHGLYRVPANEKLLAQMEAFADFAEQSGGFSIW